MSYEVPMIFYRATFSLVPCNIILTLLDLTLTPKDVLWLVWKYCIMSGTGQYHFLFAIKRIDCNIYETFPCNSYFMKSIHTSNEKSEKNNVPLPLLEITNTQTAGKQDIYIYQATYKNNPHLSRTLHAKRANMMRCKWTSKKSVSKRSR